MCDKSRSLSHQLLEGTVNGLFLSEISIVKSNLLTKEHHQESTNDFKKH